MQTAATVHADPQAPIFRRFQSAAGDHLLVIPHTRVFDVPPLLAAELDTDAAAIDRLAAMLGETSALEADLSDVVTPSPQSISLNVSSSCNLSCGYCYADRGGFHAIVEFASEHAQAQQLDIRYSITSNGTLITDTDVALFRNHRFAVTISVDGDALAHDTQRPRRNGAGSFAQLAQRVAPLLADPGRAQVAARMTVRSGCLDLAPRLDAIWSLGFSEAGVAPLRVAADNSGLRDEDWPVYLDQLIGVARQELERAKRGLPVRLTNFAIALKQIHAGASSPYSCGAGGGYFSVAADGDWYACHRAIGDKDYRLGSASALDSDRRLAFLVERHVHAKADCRVCWARYLCSGGCHQEAQARTPAGCDFIRAWLDFCLTSYCELSSARPEHFVH
jgi:uncharacterized protein